MGWGLAGFVWVGIWLWFALSCVFGCEGFVGVCLLRQRWICLGWGLAGFVWVGIWLWFALSCVFGCEGCGGCVVMAVGCWQRVVDCVDE